MKIAALLSLDGAGVNGSLNYSIPSNKKSV